MALLMVVHRVSGRCGVHTRHRTEGVVPSRILLGGAMGFTPSDHRVAAPAAGEES